MDNNLMLQQIFFYLDIFEDNLWGYLGVPLLLFLGFYLTVKSRGFQIRCLPSTIKSFVKLIRTNDTHARGIHPLKAFFASVGGCVGIGNIVGICTAVQIGGPGALFWIWVTALAGMMVKYAEVYLGLRYRVPNDAGGYNGGPMYFLQKAFKAAWIPGLVSILLCIYGVEVYQFSIIADTIITNFEVNRFLVVGVLLVLVLFASSGGVQRVGTISSAIIPFFVLLYMGMGAWVLLHHFSEIPTVMKLVFNSAFSSSAAFGGFAGSTLMLTISQGVRRGCYTGDLGVGYASVIHSESSANIPEKQASLAVLDILLDTFLICSTSVMLILVTEAWHQPMNASMLVQTALGNHFPYMHYFMPIFLFMLGYSTINAYFCVGIKCAEFLSPKHGRKIYYLYGISALTLFSFIGTLQAQTIMTIVNGTLLIINCIGIFRLRKEISFVNTQEAQPIILETVTENGS